MTRWTKQDLEILANNYSFGNIQKISSLLDNRFSYCAIVSKAYKMNIASREYWSDEELEILKIYYPIMSPVEMCELLPKRNHKTIVMKASTLKIKNIISLTLWFSDEDTQFIKDNWETMSDEDIAEKIGRKAHSIVDKRGLLGLSRQNGNSSYNDLSEYVRRNNLDWKLEAIKQSNYKCKLTGERFDDIHHVYSLDNILNEVLQKLEINVRNTMDDYSEQELTSILYEFRQVQATYPLGICLAKNIHMLFHSIYGYGKNTIAQWDNFLDEYKQGVCKIHEISV